MTAMVSCKCRPVMDLMARIAQNLCMPLPRAIRKFIARLLIGVLLFAQLAVASYACPRLMGMTGKVDGGAAAVMIVASTLPESTAAATPAGMPADCQEMDPQSPNLCAEYCHVGQQSADTAQALIVHVALLSFLYSLPLEPQRSLGSGRSRQGSDTRLEAAPEPPHAVLHCVFRI